VVHICIIYQCCRGMDTLETVAFCGARLHGVTSWKTVTFMAEVGDMSLWCCHVEKRKWASKEVPYDASERLEDCVLCRKIWYRIITNKLWWCTGSNIRHIKTITVQTVSLLVHLRILVFFKISVVFLTATVLLKWTRQTTCNVIVGRVRATTVAMEKQ
jgi:hypothetical protein